MKVKIGPYKRWFGPYQIADKVFFWIPKDKEHDLKEKFGDWLASTWVSDFCQRIYDKRERKISVKIHNFDTWDAFITLSYIIHPVLVKLKEDKHGSPFVDDEDVPENIRRSSAKPVENEWDTDEFFFDRWDYVLNEMIWAFEQVSTDWEAQFHSGKSDYVFKKTEDGYTEVLDGPNHTFKVDYEGQKAFQDRMSNGFRLFGKYYQSLWS